MMKSLLEKSKYLVLIAVIASLAAAVAAFLWGAARAFTVIVHLVSSLGKDPMLAIDFIKLIDSFLIATALLIFSVSLYELFIEDISLPPWLVIHTLQDLKTKLTNVIVLVLAVTFLEHLVEWKDPQGTLYLGSAVALVTASLIAFGYFSEKG
jgi:uncharacterized membrane protein YqhA